MTDPIITMEPAEAAVQPGSQQRVEITVRNPGSIVEGYRLEVLDDTTGGGPASWAQVLPENVQVYPGESASAVVVFTAPEGVQAPTGRFGIAVAAASTVSEGRAVAEGELEVGQVFGLQATITPTTSSGRWRGHHVVRFNNWGNAPARLRLQARDPDERLGFLLQPAEVQVPLGGTAIARLTVRTRRPFLRGTVTRLPFEVVGEPDEPGPFGRPQTPLPGDPRRPVLNGAFTQKPILGRTTVAIATLAVAALVGAVVLAFKRPASTSHFPLSMGAPATPNALVSPLADGSLKVTWNRVADVIGYKVFTMDPSDRSRVLGETQVSADQGGYQTTKLTAATEYCYAVEAIRSSKVHSAMSKTFCAKPRLPLTSATGSNRSSASSSPSSSPSGGGSTTPTSPPPSSSTGSPSGSSTGSSQSGSPTDTQAIPKGYWVWIIGGSITYPPGTSAQAYSTAHQELVKLFSEGVRVTDVIGNAQYKNMIVDFTTVPKKPQFFAPYYGPFPEADIYDKLPLACQLNKIKVCLPAIPNP